MYIINIAVNADVSAEQQEQLFPIHTEWFKKYFQAGKFLMLGPYLDAQHAGVIFAKTYSRAELDAILAEDCYYPNLATYEVREFEPKAIAEDFVAKAK